MARWVDFRRPYETMDRSFMQSVWWVFGRLWEGDLIYEGFKVMPFSTRLGTPLSNFEAGLHYKEVDDPSVVITLPLVDRPDESLLVWTTTPWTLPANLAAVVNASIVYVRVEDRESSLRYVVARSRYDAYFHDRERYVVIGSFLGEELVGLGYLPPFDYFARSASGKTFTVLGASFVEESDGTGIVHAAPAFGEADFLVCRKAAIAPVCPVDQEGYRTV